MTQSRRVNVLILDDCQVVADCIRKRILKENERKSPFSGPEIVPHYLPVDLDDLQRSAERIGDELVARRIEILLLDRGFYRMVDPKTTRNYEGLDEARLYGLRNDKGTNIEDILRLVPRDKLEGVGGFVVYTYDEGDDPDSYCEPAQVKRALAELLPRRFEDSAIEVIRSCSDLYGLAGARLYNYEPVMGHGDLESYGLRVDFMLYGLFMGDILSHRCAEMLSRRKAVRAASRRMRAAITLSVLFGVITGLNLGASALYSLLAGSGVPAGALLVVAFVCSVLLPAVVLMARPEWLIDIEN